MSVLEFKAPEKFEPTLTGRVRCAVCKSEHTAIVPIDGSGVDWLECPSCGLHKARFIYEILPDEDILMCKCGCDVFRIVPSGAFCIHCGKRTKF